MESKPNISGSPIWFRFTFVVIIGLVGWRGVWLASGVPDSTTLADHARAQISRSTKELENAPTLVRHRISFATLERDQAVARSPMTVLPQGLDVWDDTLAVWITPGQDTAPGWKTWDDNGNGIVDDESELGAAWSDDFCIVELPGHPTPVGRIIDQGGYRPSVKTDFTDHEPQTILLHAIAMPDR
jgi:hypothetical protein